MWWISRRLLRRKVRPRGRKITMPSSSALIRRYSSRSLRSTLPTQKSLRFTRLTKKIWKWFWGTSDASKPWIWLRWPSNLSWTNILSRYLAIRWDNSLNSTSKIVKKSLYVTQIQRLTINAGINVLQRNASAKVEISGSQLRKLVVLQYKQS